MLGAPASTAIRALEGGGVGVALLIIRSAHLRQSTKFYPGARGCRRQYAGNRTRRMSAKGGKRTFVGVHRGQA